MNKRKPGFFDYGGKLWVWCQALLSLVFLNLLFIAGCLPVVTIGTSLLAMTEMTIDRCRYGGEVFPIFREFWQAYKRHLRRGIPLTFALVLVFGSLVLDYMWVAGGESLFPGLFGALAAITVILMMILVYYLPLMSTGQYSLWDGVITAFFTSFSNWILALIDSLLVLALAVLCLYIPNIFVSLIPVFLLVGFSLLCRVLISFIVETLPGEDDEEEEEEKEDV